MSRRTDDIKDFQKNHPDLQIVELPGGAAGMLLPAESLPGVWSKPSTELVWLVQNGYPTQPLDCFWIDADATSSGNGKVNAQLQPCPLGTGKTRRWISWHLQPWDPLRHNIEIWLNSMRQGLRNATGRVPA